MNTDMTDHAGREAIAYPPLTFDPDEFMQYVEDQSLSEQQAHALLRTVWEIVVAFIDLRVGAHTAKQVVDHFAEARRHTSCESEAVISCPDILSIIAKNTTDGRAIREPAGKEDS